MTQLKVMLASELQNVEIIKMRRNKHSRIDKF